MLCQPQGSMRGKKVADYTQEIRVILMTNYCECICSRRGDMCFWQMMHVLLHVFCLSEAEVEKHLQDTSGKEGQSCTLSCQLSIPNVQAQWFKNGRQLEMKGKFTSEVKHKIQKLLISDLKPEDQGRYSCQYQNLESSADLWVEGLYLEIILKPSRCAGCFFF